jgi:hypothetical protein
MLAYTDGLIHNHCVARGKPTELAFDRRKNHISNAEDAIRSSSCEHSILPEQTREMGHRNSASREHSVSAFDQAGLYEAHGEGGQAFPLVHLSGLQAAGEVLSSAQDQFHQEESESLLAAPQPHPDHTPTMAHESFRNSAVSVPVSEEDAARPDSGNEAGLIWQLDHSGHQKFRLCTVCPYPLNGKLGHLEAQILCRECANPDCA